MRRSTGFTLIELAMVLALVALIAALAVPSLDALTGASLRSGASYLAGAVREAYVRAALTGKVHRLVLDLDGRAFWLEKTEDKFVLPADREREDDEHSRGTSEESDEREDLGGGTAGLGSGPVGLEALANLLQTLQARQGGGETAAEIASARNVALEEDLEKTLKRRLRRRARFERVDDELGRPVKLEHGVRFLRVWTEHQQRPARSGKVELYFFPIGHTERAHIVLTDDEEGERTLTLVVNRLTGRVRITDEEVEVPR